MSERDQILYLASWLHSYRCEQFAFRGRGKPPEHSWTECPRMARFHWAAHQAERSGEGER